MYCTYLLLVAPVARLLHLEDSMMVWLRGGWAANDKYGIANALHRAFDILRSAILLGFANRLTPSSEKPPTKNYMT